MAQVKTNVKREKILKAAQKLVAIKGFQDSTICDVALEAGVSEATIYEYFASKEELLFSIPENILDRINEVLEEHLLYSGNASSKLFSAITQFLSFYEGNPGFAAVTLLTLKTNRNFIPTDHFKKSTRVFRILKGIIREGIEKKEFTENTDPDFIRSVMTGSIENIVTRWILFGLPEDKKPTDYAENLYNLIMNTIAVK